MRPQHGSHSLACDGGVLIVNAWGPWNEEAIAIFQRDMEQALSQLPPRWAFLCYLHGEALLTPEAEVELVRVVAWRRQRGMSAMAIVTDDVTGESIVHAQLLRVYEAASVSSNFFTTEGEALSWLAAQGFPTGGGKRRKVTGA